MMRFAKAVVTACLFLLVASPALARQATLEFENRTETQLAAGERARVIVTFRYTPIANDAVGSEAADSALTASITEQREAIFARVFAATSAELAAGDATEARLHRAFDFTPAAAMYLTREEIEALATDPGVARIETDEWDRVTLDASIAEIGANVLHSGGIDGAGATIAILDTGIDYDHPAFAGRITGSACFSSQVAGDGTVSSCIGGAAVDTISPRAATYCFDDNPLDACFHGTHVASIAAGVPGGSYPYSGVAPGAKIVAVQVFSEMRLVPNDCPVGTRCTVSYVSDQIAALEWIYANRETLGVDVINMSLGGAPRTGSCNSDPRTSIISQLKTTHITTVVAAGNDGVEGQMSSPACISDTVSVTATNGSARIAGFANVSELTDLAAPGQDISAAGHSGNLPPVSTQSGTSMAAPHVAGGFAVAASLFSGVDSDDILNAMSTAGIPVIWDDARPPVPSLRLDLAIAALSNGNEPETRITVSPDGANTVSARSANPYAEYVLTNTSSTVQNWSVHSSVPWLDFSLAPPGAAADGQFERLSGAIEPGASVSIFVSPARVLAEGRYAAVLVFETPQRSIVRDLYIEFRPPNDNFANAAPLGLRSAYASVHLALATVEAGETHPDAATNSIWFAFTPPETRTYVVETSAASSGVYSGGPDNLAARRLDTGPVGTRRIRDFPFHARAGQTVYIALADPVSDGAQIRIRTSGNDNLSGSAPWEAIRLNGGSGSVQRFGSNAVEPLPGEPSLGQSHAARHWFVWTAPFTGTASLADRIADNNRISTFAVFERTDGADDHAPTDDWSMLEPVAQLEMTSAPANGEDDSASRNLQFAVTEGQTYWIRVGREDANWYWRFTYGAPRDDGHHLRAAVLPTIRRVTLGQTATVFMTVINPARFGETARNCRVIANGKGVSYDFSYRLTDASNRAIGGEDATFNLAPGAAQTLVLAVTPSIETTVEPSFSFHCDNVVPVEPPDPIEDLIIAAYREPAADIISIAQTQTGDGVVDLVPTGTRAFAVAAVNIGAANDNVDVQIGGVHNGLELLQVCETDNSGQCVTARGASLTTSFGENEVKTFTVFLRTRDYAQPFDPATYRIWIEFNEGFQAGNRFGRTSVATRVEGGPPSASER